MKDFDEVVRYLISLGYNVSTEAKSFRVVKVALENGEVVDVAGFRAEEYDLVSRKPRVAPVESIEQDLSRRDFTINAMAIRVDNVFGDKLVGALIDPFDGLRDLERGVIRAVRNRLSLDVTMNEYKMIGMNIQGQTVSGVTPFAGVVWASQDVLSFAETIFEAPASYPW